LSVRRRSSRLDPRINNKASAFQETLLTTVSAARPRSTGLPTEASATGTNQPVVSFESVGKTFNANGKDLEAVRDVNLSVRSGEFVTLVGPSGCGKSTLLNMTAGLMTPSRGTVRYAGAVVRGIHGRVGYMTQNDHLLPWRTVAGNIEVPLEIRGLSRHERAERVAELIDTVGLNGFEKSWPTQISGGMRKRTALARVLAYDPETLLMDEPFAALDAQLRLQMQADLLALCSRLGKTVLFVTHDLDEAVALADRCVVFSSRPGSIVRVIETGLPHTRDLLDLRFDRRFLDLAHDLWATLMPALRRRRD
jgi:NitT/TauT family transport system ATP-binding protein